MAFKKDTDWIGVDMDGTLAYYEKGDYDRLGAYTFGPPIPAMVERIKWHLAQGHDVRVVTARHSNGANYDHDARLELAVAQWTEANLGKALKCRASKDGYMHALYDDRAIAVEYNTGRLLGGQRIEEMEQPIEVAQ